MQQLTTAQRQYLRRQAHDLKPVIQIGKNGLTDKIVEATDLALDAHELIKVKFTDVQDQKEVSAQELADRVNSNLITLIGNIAILCRRQPDPEKRKIALPTPTL